MTSALPAAVERALLGLLVLVGVTLRALRHVRLDPPPFEPLLFTPPYVRPPLLDLITAPFPDRMLPVLALSAVAILLSAALGRRALGALGGVGCAALAAVCPALLQAGSVWLPQSLVVVTVPALALALLRRLDGERSPGPLIFLLTLLALATDWSGWPPVLAWLAWVTVLRPEWMSAQRARPLARALGAGVLAAAPAYAAIVWAHPHFDQALGVRELPLGAGALEALLNTLAAPWAGVNRDAPLLLRAAAAASVAAALWFGPRRAAATGQQAWAGVLFVGSAGAFVPALAAHPWVALAADKQVWYMSPFVLALALASLWPVRAATALAALLLLGTGCVDADGDGSFAPDDCDDGDPRLHPGALELYDGLDNDCDGQIDVSSDYLVAADREPNDTSLGGCFAPSGQDLGSMPRPGMLTRIVGRIDSVVDGSYTEGDRDCFAFRLGPDSKAARVQVTLSWSDERTDLDMALWGLFEGEQAGFIQATSPGPGPEVHVSSGAFEEGEPLWLWVAAYDGPPTDYRIEILAR